MPDSALRFCAARLYCVSFHDITKPWLQNVYDDTKMVCISNRHC